MLNTVILIGRLTKDPELKDANGTPVCRFTLAVDRPPNKSGEKETDFIDCIAWRSQAENLVKYRGKGDPVAVEGRLQVRSYDDSQGVRRKAAEVIARRITFLPTGRKQTEEAPLPEAPPEPFGDPVDMSEDELPF